MIVNIFPLVAKIFNPNANEYTKIAWITISKKIALAKFHLVILCWPFYMSEEVFDPLLVTPQ